MQNTSIGCEESFTPQTALSNNLHSWILTQEELLKFPHEYIRELGKEKFIAALTTALKDGIWKE